MVLKKVVDKNKYMSSYREKLSKKTLSFDRKNLSAILIIAFGMVMMGGYGASQVSAGYDVSIGSNGIEMGTGTLDVLGNDIESSGTTIWDASAGEIPDAVLGIDLSTNAGNDLTWDSTNNEFDVDSSNIQSGTTASDVGLGNVENEAAVAESGDTMTGPLVMNSDGGEFGDEDISGGSTSLVFSYDDSVNDENIQINQDSIALRSSTSQYAEFDEEFESGSLSIHGGGQIYFDANNDDSQDCRIEGTGDIECSGSKNWIHNLDNKSEAVYTSQESPQVRAVYEGKAEVDGETKVELPSHYSKTVSDEKPMLRSTATVQGKLAYAAVIEKTDDYIVLDSSEPAIVNYRVTGVREGYEDKQVVRPKEE